MGNQKILSGKKILLADDDDLLRDAVKKILVSFGAEVIQATDGKVAQNLIAIENPDLVFSDIRMPGCNGIELLHFVKREKPDLPVILTTGFGELKETKEAFDLGAKGFIAKPFSREDLRKVIADCLGLVESSAPENTDEEYCKLNIDDFITGKQIRFDIFIRLAKDKYVKIANGGDDIPVDRIKVYKSKSITHLYMKRQDFGSYIGLNLEIATKLKDADSISSEKKINFIKHTGEIILEQCFLNELNDGLYETAKNAVENTLSVLFDIPDMSTLLASLNSHSDYLYAHSVGVSFYASLIAREMKWENPRTLYKLSMAGLLHDIGKKDFDKALLEKNRSVMTPEEVKIYESHPSKGAEMLTHLRAIPGEVLQIVQQHHENCLGTGFPEGLKKNHIHPMARVIRVADEFCHLVIKSPQGEPLPLGEALEKICFFRSQEFDRSVIDALLAIFDSQFTAHLQKAE